LADIGASDTDPFSTNILFRARVAVVAITGLWFYRAPLLDYVAQVLGAGVPVVARDHQANLAHALYADPQRAVQVRIASRAIRSVLEDTITGGDVTDPFGAIGGEGGTLIIVGADLWDGRVGCCVGLNIAGRAVLDRFAAAGRQPNREQSRCD